MVQGGSFLLSGSQHLQLLAAVRFFPPRFYEAFRPCVKGFRCTVLALSYESWGGCCVTGWQWESGRHRQLIYSRFFRSGRQPADNQSAKLGIVSGNQTSTLRRNLPLSDALFGPWWLLSLQPPRRDRTPHEYSGRQVQDIALRRLPRF